MSEKLSRNTGAAKTERYNSMQDLVAIRAEQLKWCKHGFAFSVCSEHGEKTEDWFSHYIDHGNEEKYDSLIVSQLGEIFSKASVLLVDPVEYEKAVTERINEMFEFRVLSVEKTSNGIEVGLLENGQVVWVKADPRPWESGYVIDVE